MLICVMLMLVHIRKESVYIYPSFFTSYILYFQVSYAFDVVTLIFRGADDEWIKQWAVVKNNDDQTQNDVNNLW